jgi:hypothetical protein
MGGVYVGVGDLRRVRGSWARGGGRRMKVCVCGWAAWW